jgi:tRNA1(Val) A37 N6-methylase TrmN6
LSAIITDAITDDAALGGRLHLLQPKRGHRFGHDAILLAAAVPARAGERAVDLGAGVGAAGLALAKRVDGVSLTLVEIDPALCKLARENGERNGMADRVAVITLDVNAPASSFEQSGLKAATDHVLMNPPFHDAARTQASPDAARRSAHVAEAGSIAAWIDAAARLLRPGGMLTLIYRADGLDEVETALARDFESVNALPVYPKPGSLPIRVIVQAMRHTQAGDQKMRAENLRSTLSENRTVGLYLNGTDGRPTPEAEAVLRHAAPLPVND